MHDLGTYVYLASLQNTDPDFAAKAKEYSTFDLTSAKNNDNEEIQPIQEAINQLKNIAATQAQKEHEAIQNYKRKIEKYLKDESCPKALKEKLTAQREKLNARQLDFNSFQSDQYELVNAINIISTDLNNYKKRLNEIRTPASRNTVSQRLPYNIQSRVEQFLENQSQKKYKTKNVRRDRKLNTMIKTSMSQQLRGVPQELIQELYSLVFIDFNVWLDNNNQSYNKITEDDLDNLYETYLNLSGNAGKETHFQKILRTSNNELLILLKDLQSQLHSTYLSEEDVKKLNTFIEEVENEETKRKIISINDKQYSLRQAKGLVKTYNEQLSENENKRFSFTFHTATSHGNFYEFLSTLIAPKINVSGNVGADLIAPFGTITFGINDEQNEQRLLHLSRDLGALITDDFERQQTITIQNFNEQIEKQKELSKSLQQSMTNRAKTLTKMGEFNEQFFIVHESLKMYSTSEIKDSNFEEFHGRKMKIMSALTKLYASSNLATSMVKPELLITYLINISDATLAHNQQPLETYLSLFAGLLMFDDIRSLAEVGVANIINNTNAASVEALHVYNIDGVYFPISVILNNLIEQMSNIIPQLQSLTSKNTAIAVIEGPTPEEPKPSQYAWEALANSTIQKTTIQIHFLQGFSEYIQQLFTNLG